MNLVPKAIFLTRGVGYHKDRLTSFEEALRKAEIARFNLVNVSSIFPPHCRVISKEKGLEKLQSGQIVFTVMARIDCNEFRRLLSASIGLAIPQDRSQHGYLSEYHTHGKKEQETGDYAEDLAASMLATTMGVDIDMDKSWNERKELWKLGGKFYRTQNVTQAAVCPNGLWATALAAAVLIL